MKPLEEDTTQLIDSIYHQMIENPKATLDSFTAYLTELGIKPGLNEVLSLISGYALGMASSVAFLRDYDNDQMEKFQNQTIETLNKKTTKLREAIKNHIEELNS
jgi:demethoxyubiquinone hydroxylase (CLK1/Coq7/Cat5 family)